MLKSLQAGRGVAALAVAAFHLSSMIAPQKSVLSALSRHGNAGVDFFFVLSGFIILYAHEKDIDRPKKLFSYYWKRFVRVYPNYWFYTIIVIFAIVAGFGDSKIPNGILNWITTFSLIRLTDVETPLNVAWTLFYEIAFYIVFSVLIINRKIGSLLFIIWAISLAFLARKLPTNSALGIWLSPICRNFLFGMFACWLHSRISVRVGALLAVVGSLGVVVAAIFVDRGLGESFGLLIAVSCTLLIAGFSAIERRHNLNFGPLSALGDASYTLYLVHVHVESPLMKLVHKLDSQGKILPDFEFIAVIGSTSLISYFLYRLIEQRSLRWLRNLSLSNRAQPESAQEPKFLTR